MGGYMRILILLIFLSVFSSGTLLAEDRDLKEIIKSAEQGNAIAQFFLGVMYCDGQGVPQDYKKAVKWYRLAAEKGYSSAQTSLGTLYDQGRGVPQDYKEAVKWYRRAAKQGHAIAQFSLGVMYYDGQSVPQNYKEAYTWFNVAAAQGYKDAAKNREIVEKELSPKALNEAQELSKKYFKKYDKE